jgi:hypothetical protein
LPISPIAYRPDEDKPGGATGGAAASKSNAISIIAQGVRRGTFGALTDFYERLKNMREQARRAGVTNASYEPGSDGSGAGAGGPAAHVGRAFRRQGVGGGYVPHGVRARGGGGTPTGNEAVLAKQGYDYWRSQGLTHDQALSVLGNERGENPLGARTVGDPGKFGGHGTVGQFQWDPPRRAQILAGTGIDVATAGFLDQQKAARWEMEHSPDAVNRVWDWLKAAKTREAQVGLLVHNYERSADQPRDIAKRMGFADRYARLGLDKATVAGGPGRSPSGPVAEATSGAQAKHGEALRKMFGERGPQKAPTVGHQPLPGQQDVSLRPGDLRRREPGSLLRAADQRQAAALKHTVSGEASLKIALASGLKPVGGVSTKGSLFKEIRMDRAPLPLASTMG